MRKDAVSRETSDNDKEIAVDVLGRNIARWTEQGELHATAVPGLSLFRRDEPTGPIRGMYEPSICLVAQGAKRVLLAERMDAATAAFEVGYESPYTPFGMARFGIVPFCGCRVARYLASGGVATVMP